MLKQAFADIQYLSCHDKLTGIYNRYRFDQDITTEMERSDRYDFSLAMIIYDLDRFKQVNDTYGHQIGDEVLTRSAEIAKKCIHHGDVLARFGGEEFVILAPYTNLAGAILIAESIRKAMEQENFPTANTVTASFGVAEKFHGESYTAWFKRVDLALYQAKAMGRNRVCSDHDIKELV